MLVPLNVSLSFATALRLTPWPEIQRRLDTLADAYGRFVVAKDSDRRDA